MCGIIALLRRPAAVRRLDLAPLVTQLTEAAVRLEGDGAGGTLRWEALGDAAEAAAAVDRSLRGLNGAASLLADPQRCAELKSACERLDGLADRIEEAEANGVVPADRVEAINAGLIALRDRTWAIARDRLRAADGIVDLMGPDPSPGALAAGLSMHQALSALDRLEVRGRDSAGIQLFVTGHDLDLDSAQVRALLAKRRVPLFGSGAVRTPDGSLSFVYKAAAEIGELGDNTASLRAAVLEDELLRLALDSPNAWTMVLGHTRWASVGIISEANAHPQSSEEAAAVATFRNGTTPDVRAPFATAVLNGDVDNHADLAAAESLELPAEVTTDAKVIPVLWSRRLAEGLTSDAAFRNTVAPMEGSVAIAGHSAAHPGELMLALRGSGQALYVGLADDAFVVASEPYGVVEETSRFVRMDGETPSDPANPTATRGQILRLDAAAAGTIEGITRWSYDGTDLPLSEADVVTAEVTTRDIDRGEFPHFLLKELGDAPSSFAKTLRGKLLEHPDGGFEVRLPATTLPLDVRAGLGDRSIDRVMVIGQGTAAIAGQSLAFQLGNLLSDTDVDVDALPATELSGFQLRADMSDTLIVAISQSGTTTDTNRTVDLARGRGAKVVAIVNRRNSDLVDKSDGVLYTADGRDVEMSVASTKAFYSQIAAGLLLAYGIAAATPGARTADDPDEQLVLAALSQMPSVLEATLGVRPQCAEAAGRFAVSRRYWALVGNGPNIISARELRIKLSELCYKSMACDATEDKKHIDLSSEPLILICAAGLVGSTAADVGKEVAIFRAHQAAPVVIATEGASEFPAAMHVISVPETHPRLAFILSAMAGHLFGYEAALAIDAQARILREARVVVEGALASGVDSGELLVRLRSELAAPAGAWFAALRAGELNGHLEASTANRVATAFRFALGTSPLDAYQVELGKIGTPGVVVDDLISALNDAIDELTRPIDAIKHQAKTVTVGISRSDESVLEIPLVKELFAAGANRDRISYRTLRTLADLSPVVREVRGFVRYDVSDADGEMPTATVLDKGGVASALTSRLERDPRLRGTKHLVAREQELLVTRGRTDGRTVVIVPQMKDGATTGLVLLHVELADRVEPATARSVLQGYRRRYQGLSDAVTETEEHFRDDLLGEQPVIDLLALPVLELAERWRSAPAAN
ncbi:MAG: SIS domain-containing protein [Microthrixaceae bacterium]